jgi:Trypsin-like peptidase domain
MLTPAQIAAALTTNRTEFAKLFWQAQPVPNNPPPETRVEFEAIVTQEPDVRKAFELALTYAEQKNFLPAVIFAVVMARLENGTLSNFIVGANQRAAHLQAMTNDVAGFVEPLLLAKGILRCSQITGKVMITGASKGTGLLIGPNLFLTAWHVIQDMFDTSVDAQGKLACTVKAPLPTLQVEFNNMLDEINDTIQPIGSLTLINAHKEWLVSYCTCHPQELTGNIPINPVELDNYSDYAIIRLAKTIGFERKWVAPKANNRVPEENARIVLLQHPNGVPLKMDLSNIVDMVPHDAPPPPYRFLHQLNALPGSSGGPCFDKEFSLFGIHQGEWPTKVNGNTTNRGIPIAPIIKHYSKAYAQLPLPDPADCPIWCMDKKTLLPFIGYDDIQSEIWKTVIPGNRRVLAVNGDEATGKTFLASLIFAILPDDEHLKIIFEGDEIAQMTEMDIIKYICDKVGMPVPTFLSEKDFSSATPAWLKDELALKLVNAMDIKREKRLVWILIKDLNKVSIKGENASEFLFNLYDYTSKREWLRIVLDGMRADISEIIRPFTERYRTHEIKLEEIQNFFRRAFTELHNEKTSGEINILGRLFHLKYKNALVGDPKAAMKQLADECHLALSV